MNSELIIRERGKTKFNFRDYCYMTDNFARILESGLEPDETRRIQTIAELTEHVKSLEETVQETIAQNISEEIIPTDGVMSKQEIRSSRFSLYLAIVCSAIVIGLTFMLFLRFCGFNFF